MSNVTLDDLINKRSTISSKIDRTIDIQIDIISTLKAHGCPSCLELVRQIVKKYVDLPLATATNLKPTSDESGLHDASY